MTTDLNQFQEPFDVSNYVEGYVNGKISKWKSYDNILAIKSTVETKYDELKKVMAEVSGKIDESEVQKKSIFKESANCEASINIALTNACDSLKKFSESIVLLGTQMNKFGKSIAVHELVIERASYVETLVTQWAYFTSPTNLKRFVVLLQTLRIFHTLQSLVKVTKQLKQPKFSKISKEISSTHDRFELFLRSELVNLYKEGQKEKMKKIIDSVVFSELFYYALISYFQTKPEDQPFTTFHTTMFKKFCTLCKQIFHLNYKTLVVSYEFVTKALDVKKADYLVFLEDVYQQ
ncbi:hypothetical protein RF11_14578 [Thelohanellus kitauei]|uniref:Uncharacterized protein n=1 Tax=Thelohanellus kitauei TaxID=669202 RepID=A0A0C2N460_THEKT|nr:hypothetical protein RF11_14578 [Thelohanellus kitauei]